MVKCANPASALPTHSRYLRARKWVVNDAYQQFKDTEDWRQANHLDVLYDTIDVDAYEQTRRLVRGEGLGFGRARRLG
jgi:hypothetical protein